MRTSEPPAPPYTLPALIDDTRPPPPMPLREPLELPMVDLTDLEEERDIRLEAMMDVLSAMAGDDTQESEKPQDSSLLFKAQVVKDYHQSLSKCQ